MAIPHIRFYYVFLFFVYNISVLHCFSLRPSKHIVVFNWAFVDSSGAKTSPDPPWNNCSCNYWYIDRIWLSKWLKNKVKMWNKKNSSYYFSLLWRKNYKSLKLQPETDSNTFQTNWPWLHSQWPEAETDGSVGTGDQTKNHNRQKHRREQSSAAAGKIGLCMKILLDRKQETIRTKVLWSPIRGKW